MLHSFCFSLLSVHVHRIKQTFNQWNENRQSYTLLSHSIVLLKHLITTFAKHNNYKLPVLTHLKINYFTSVAWYNWSFLPLSVSWTPCMLIYIRIYQSNDSLKISHIWHIPENLIYLRNIAWKKYFFGGSWFCNIQRFTFIANFYPIIIFVLGFPI